MNKGIFNSYFINNYFSESLKKSYGYNGRGTATYPNGDIYEGPFVEGVSFIITLTIKAINLLSFY